MPKKSYIIHLYVNRYLFPHKSVFLWINEKIFYLQTTVSKDVIFPKVMIFFNAPLIFFSIYKKIPVGIEVLIYISPKTDRYF